MSDYEPSEAEVEAAAVALSAELEIDSAPWVDDFQRKLARAALIAAHAVRAADDEPDGAPMHAWEVTEGWQPKRASEHDEHNAERWPR